MKDLNLTYSSYNKLETAKHLFRIAFRKEKNVYCEDKKPVATSISGPRHTIVVCFVGE